MTVYQTVYEELFVNNLRRYASQRDRIKKRIDRLVENPYANSEYLSDASGRLDLRGCRSVRLDRNFRMIYVICEECRRIPACQFCFCEDVPDQTIVFLTVGPHDKAYAMK